MNKKAIIFDLDGTLIDSLKDIAISANLVLEEFNLPIHDIFEYKNFVGGGASVLVDNCVPKNSNEDLKEKVLNRFKEIYDQEHHLNTKPYDGINEVLEQLTKQNIKIGILSNKPHYFTCKYVEEFFSNYNFLEVHGQKENIPKKPHPKVPLEIADSFNIEPENIFFVGDSDVDIKTAINSKMIPVGVKWGFRGPRELIDNGAKYIVDTPKDILKLFEK